MRLWNRGLLALAVAGVLCGATATSQAQQKKVNGKKAAPPAEKSAVVPGALGEAVPHEGHGAPGLLPTPWEGIPSLQYNYYHPAPGAYVPDTQAQMYLCPLPYPPPYVGYTYITYPPFQPHEWLWIHNRAYYRVHPDGGTTLTTIRWDYHAH